MEADAIMKFHTIMRSTLLQILFAILCAVTIAAQSRTSIPNLDSSSSDEEENRFGSSIREMSQRAYFERLNAEHKQNIKRAGEGAALASDLLRSFNQSRALSTNDAKNLERLEKIARRLRSHAGGSDDERDSAVESTVTLGDSLSQIAELSSSLQQEVERTARQIVSAKLIADANRLISLVRHARDLTRRSDD